MTDLSPPSSERAHQVDAYLESLFVDADSTAAAVLKAQRDASLPDIAVSPMHARLLGILARSIGATTVVEFGTLGGYSTLHLARSVPPNGRVITHERDAGHAEVARTSLEKAGVGHKVTIRIGQAFDHIPALADDAPVDLTFIDADKRSNTAYFEAALAVSRPGSLIVVDNVVHGGDLADLDNEDEYATGARAVVELAARDPRVEATVIQTVGRKGYDGLLIATVL
ncbi:O-methyltransferase [Demequina sp. TTPB684]|uniref:O-methyltransferase n=1 Tax=unclassified Demequina TaxID=2620311 RepID=UPI001CF1A40A|nr:MULTISPECIES: O-methyltransferase [unclassified Demequina]MCB2411805.1 O-methyltransferase [Demequina sp. TTPB684]UPU88318.1 O-methyltransferase [Demequina sp. TMPB413]